MLFGRCTNLVRQSGGRSASLDAPLRCTECTNAPAPPRDCARSRQVTGSARRDTDPDPTRFGQHLGLECADAAVLPSDRPQFEAETVRRESTVKSLTAPTAAADARETAGTDQAGPVARTRRPAQPLPAARRPVDEAHAPHAPSPLARPYGGYMLGGGTSGGFMLGSGN